MRPTCQICEKMWPPAWWTAAVMGFQASTCCLRPEAGDVGVADSEGVDGCAFGEDEPGGGALGVVVDHDGRRDVVGRAAEAGEGRHEDAVGEVEVADLDGIEER